MLICLVLCKIESFNGYLIRTIEGQGRTEEGVQGKIEMKRSCGFPFASRKLFANCSDGRGHWICCCWICYWNGGEGEEEYLENKDEIIKTMKRNPCFGGMLEKVNPSWEMEAAGSTCQKVHRIGLGPRVSIRRAHQSQLWNRQYRHNSGIGNIGTTLE